MKTRFQYSRNLICGIASALYLLCLLATNKPLLAAEARDFSTCAKLYLELFQHSPGVLWHRVDVAAVYAKIAALDALKLPYVKITQIGTSDKLPILQIRIASSSENPIRILITAGVHGDEPVGTQTALALLDYALESPEFRKQYELTVIPMVNPGGLSKSTRSTIAGTDLNRNFLAGNLTPAVLAIRNAVVPGYYDISVDLHGSLADGFFMIMGSPDPELGRQILQNIPPRVLLHSDSGEFPGYVARPNDPHRYYLFSPGVAESNNTGTLKSFMTDQGTPFAFTLEYPAKLGIEEQRRWHYRIVEAIISTTSKLLPKR